MSRTLARLFAGLTLSRLLKSPFRPRLLKKIQTTHPEDGCRRWAFFSSLLVVETIHVDLPPPLLKGLGFRNS